MNNIERIVKDNNISEKRERMLKNRETILHIKKKMSDLKLKKNVAEYAYNFGLIDYLIKDDNLDELDKIIERNKILLQDENVLYYDNLRRNTEYLEQENSYYYQSINKDLRWSLYDEMVPNIFVLQNKNNGLNLYRHIIIPEFTTSDELVGDAVIIPYTEKSSPAYLRHFYNRISFQYLEQLSKDYSYSIDNKYFGMVKILKK